MRGHGAGDMRAIGNALEDALNGTRRHANGVMDCKVSIYERAHTVGKGNDAALCLRAIGPALAVDHEAMVLPVDVFSGESGELGNPQAGVEERPDNQALLVGLA